jgi:hypothetical protein
MDVSITGLAGIKLLFPYFSSSLHCCRLLHLHRACLRRDHSDTSHNRFVSSLIHSLVQAQVLLQRFRD